MDRQTRTARIAILVLAAGFGTRMRGADKLLMEVEGVPLLRRQTMEALAASTDVVVTLPEPPGARGAALRGLGVLRVPVADAAEGMAASIRAGCRALPAENDGVMIVPGDMPELGRAEFGAMIAAFDPDAPAILRGTSARGRPGHPVLFPRRDIAGLQGLAGDTGARSVLEAAAHIDMIALPGEAALTDLDTPEAWAAWRARRSEPGRR